MAYAAAKLEQRKWLRREVDFLVRVIFPSHGIRQVHSTNLRVLNVSEGGAALHIGQLSSAPDFFYLQFGDEKSALIGCYVVQRTPETMSCRFSKEISTEDLDVFIAQKSMEKMLGSLFSDTD